MESEIEEIEEIEEFVEPEPWLETTSPGVRFFLLCSVFFLLMVVFTWPLVFHIGDAIPVAKENAELLRPEDHHAFMWNLWWFKDAVQQHKSPFYCNKIHYPLGVPLGLHTFSITHCGLAFILTYIVSLTTSYNLLLLVAIFMSAFGGYLLARMLGLEVWLSALAGALIAVNPYTMAHLRAHLNLVSTQWFLLAIFVFMKVLDNPGKGWMALAGLLSAMTVCGSWYYGLYFVLIALVIWIIKFANTWDRMKFYEKEEAVHLSLRVFGSGVLGIVLSLPALIPAIKAWREGVSPYVDFELIIKYSADLLSYIVPSMHHPLLGSIGDKALTAFDISEYEGILFLGVAVVLLGIFGLKAFWKAPLGKFWIITGGLAFVLSLGPVLKVAGKMTFFGIGPIPLPGYLLWQVPVFSAARVPARFGLLVMIAFIFAACFGLKRFHVMLGQNDRRKALIVTVLFSVAMFWEYLPMPVVLLSTHIDRFYQDIATESDDETLLNLPLSPEWRYYQYLQTTHGYNRVGGFHSRPRPQWLDRLNAFTALKYLNGDISINVNEAKLSFAEITDLYSFKYIVLHPQYHPHPEIIKTFLIKELSCVSVASRYDEDTHHYEAFTINPQVVQWMRQQIKKAGYKLTLFEGWHKTESDGTNSWVWSQGEEGVLAISLPDSTYQYLNLVVAVMPILYEERILELYWDQELILRGKLKNSLVDQKVSLRLPRSATTAGWHFLKLKVNKAIIPIQANPEEFTDDRLLGICLKDIQLMTES